MRGQMLTKSKLLLLLLLTISHLTQIMSTVSGHQVFLVDTVIRPLISLRCALFVALPEAKVSNTTLLPWGVGSLRRSYLISSRAQNVEPSELGVQVKPRGQSAVRSGASSGESSRLTTPPTPGRSWDSPASTNEVLLRARRHLQRNSESFTRGNSPEPDELNMFRPLDQSRGGSPTNNDNIFTAGEGQLWQAQLHGRKCQEDSCVCTGVEGPNRVFTNTRSRSSSRAPEARNGSEMKKARVLGTRE